MNTTLWISPSEPEKMGLQPLRCWPDHLAMAEEYSLRIMKALERHNQEVDGFSMECNHLTGAITCSILPVTAAVNPIERAKKGIVHIFSTLINEETRPDPPVEAHVEPLDRNVGKALHDVPDGLSDAPTNLREAARRPD